MTRITLPDLAETPLSIATDDGRRLDVPRDMSVAEFMAFPWPEHERWELLEGVPVMSPSPAPRHQSLLAEILHFLMTHLPGWDVLPGIDVAPPGYRSYVCPDLVVLDAIGDLERPTQRTPALAVEVLSPTNQSNDRATKFALYEGAGIPEYWIADPANARLTIYILDDATDPREYRESPQDADGFAASRLFATGIRVSRPGRRFVIERQP